MTPSQRDQLGLWRDGWLATVCATGSADRAALERAVDRLYAAASLPAPVKVWFDSPLSGGLAADILCGMDRPVWGRVGALRRDRLLERACDGVPRSDWRELQEALAAPVWSRGVRRLLPLVVEEMGRPLEPGFALADFYGPMLDRLRAALGPVGEGRTWDEARVAELINWAGLGALEADSLVLADFVSSVLGVALPEAEEFKVLAGGGPWWPFETVAVLTDRPQALSFDESGRLHRADGPALLYPDGFSVWAWRGMRAPRRIVQGQFTLSEIDDQSNAEYRRAMIERFGPERYMKEGGAQVIDRDSCGTLYRREVPGDEPLVMVRVVNSTPEPDGSRKEYWLRVPPTMQKAREAVAWTFGMTAGEYRPSRET